MTGNFSLAVANSQNRFVLPCKISLSTLKNMSENGLEVTSYSEEEFKPLITRVAITNLMTVIKE